MIVDNVKKTTTNNRTRVSADVIWEDCDRPTQNIFMETEAEFGEDLNCNPNSFVLGTILPAMYHGEGRLKIEGKVCPILRNGLITVIQILRQWYGEERHGDVQIEPSEGFASASIRKDRVSSFMSGGIDALTTLRINRIDHPLEHPASIKDCFFVHGMDVGGYTNYNGNQANSDNVIESHRRFAQKSNITLIPVWTNIRHLEDDDSFFYFNSHGSCMASIAHAFHHRIGEVKIASTATTRDLEPHGSHPLLDPNFSSYNVTIRHDGIRFSRLEKVRLVSQWPEALSTLRSCFNPFRPEDVLNCGKCEKCLRTMSELLIHGKLAEAPTFQYNDLTSEIIEKIDPHPFWMLRIFKKDILRMDFQEFMENYGIKAISPTSIYYWKEMIEPLNNLGRSDLAKVIASKVMTYQRLQFLTRTMKNLDRRLLAGMLSSFNSSLLAKIYSQSQKL